MSILSALKKKFNAKGNNIEEAIKTMEVDSDGITETELPVKLEDGIYGNIKCVCIGNMVTLVFVLGSRSELSSYSKLATIQYPDGKEIGVNSNMYFTAYKTQGQQSESMSLSTLGLFTVNSLSTSTMLMGNITFLLKTV